MDTNKELALADRAAAARISTDISDLFFNHDISHTVVSASDGTFIEYDEAKLKDEAAVFLASLEGLGVAVPTVDELIADFYGRI